LINCDISEMWTALVKEQILSTNSFISVSLFLWCFHWWFYEVHFLL